MTNFVSASLERGAGIAWTTGVVKRLTPTAHQFTKEDGARYGSFTVQQKGSLERHPFDVLYLERLRAGDTIPERHFSSDFSDLIRLKVRARGLATWLDDIRQETFVRVLRTLRSADGLRDPGVLGRSSMRCAAT